MAFPNGNVDSIRMTVSDRSMSFVFTVLDAENQPANYGYGASRNATTGMFEINLEPDATTIQAKFAAGELPEPDIDDYHNVEALEADGINYPCDATSPARVLAQRAVLTTMGRDATTTVDATTGKRSIALQGDLTVERRSHTSTPVALGNDVWAGEYMQSTRDGYFFLNIALDDDQPALMDTEDSFEAQEKFGVFIDAMNSIKGSSDADVVGGANLADWTGRTFTVNPGNTGEISFTMAGVYYLSEFPTEGWVLWDYILTAGTLNRAALETWIQAQSSTVVGGHQDAVSGGSQAILRGGLIRFPSGNEFREMGGQFYIQGTDADDLPFNVPLGSDSGRIRAVNSFPTASANLGGFTTYEMDLPPYLRTVYMPVTGITTDLAMQLPRPSSILNVNGSSLAIRFLNESAAQSLHIYDWTGEIMFILRRDRLATVEITFDENGQGRAHVTQIHPRIFVSSDNSPSSADQGIAGRRFVFPNDPNSTWWYPLPIAYVDRDEDSFAYSSADTPFTSAAPFGNRGIQVVHGGELLIRAGFEFEITGSGVATGADVKFAIFRNSAIGSAGNNRYTDTISQANSPYDVEIQREILMYPGEWITLGWNLKSGLDVASVGNIISAYYHLSLRPHILVTET